MLAALRIAIVFAACSLCACLAPCNREAPVTDLNTLGLLSSCEEIQGSLIISIPDVTKVELPSLRAVSGALTLNGNPALTSVRFEKLERISHVAAERGQNVGLNIQECPELAEAHFPALATVGTMEGIERAGVGASRAPKLATLALPALTQVAGELHLIGTQLMALDLTQQEELGALRLVDNVELTSLSAPSLHTVRGELIIGNPALTTVDLSALSTVGEAGGLGTTRFGASFSGNAKLSALRLPALEKSGLGFEFSNNAAATRLELTAQSLSSLPVLTIADNAALEAVLVPSPEQIENLRISGNQTLTSIDFAGLARAFSFEISDNSSLPTCAAKSLADRVQIDGTRSIYGNLVDSCSP